MCNCNSNFDGYDGEMDNLVDRNDNEFMLDDRETFSNYSDLHEEDEDIDYDEGGVRQYRADGGLDYGSDFEDEDFEGGSGYEPIGEENRLGYSFEGEYEFKPSSQISDTDDPEFESFSHEAEEGDGEFDDFLTKRSRARRKLRKKLRKSGKSRKEARKLAVSKIPKQKLGKLFSNAIKGKTDPETNSIIKKLEAKGVIDTKKDGIEKVAEQIETAVNENTDNGSQKLGSTETSVSDGTNAVIQSGGGSNKKMMIIIGVGAVAIIGGYFAFFRK